MKRAEYTTSLVHAFLAIALTSMLSACVGRSLDPINGNGGDGSLAVRGTVSEGTLVTKAESVEGLKEKQLNSLDVFVEKATKNEDGSFTGSGSLMKQYHLVASTEVTIQEAAQNWLADYWKDEGLEVGQYYNIYVAANNPKTKTDVASVEALKALTYSEVEEGSAVVQDNNIGWKDGKTSGNVYKLYDTNPGDARALTSEKEFMMDGVIEGWTPDEASRDQVFDVTLNRAAAKFVLNVKFKAEFLASLAAEGVSITGSPAWKFYNFAFGAPVFAPEAQGEGVEIHNSGFNIFHNQEYTGEDKHFTITTYSYPNQWDAANYATDAPSLVISVGYAEGEGDAAVTNYHYYRIPLVKSTTTAIERNHIYAINATIATRGSATQEDVTETEDVEYAVLPWNDETNSAAIHNDVESVQHLYLKVNPKTYTLRGDGEQSVTINYLKGAGTKVNWKLFTYDANGKQTSVVTNNAEGATRAWFYNAQGVFTSSYGDNSGTDWSNMGVDIVQSTEGSSGSSGTFTVTSQALTNKAIKYIRFRVYLEESETLYEDVIIRHFPTDNIQNIAGSWSSYHDASGSTELVTLTTRILSEAQSWAEQYGINYTTTQVPITDPISYAEYSLHETDDGYSASVVDGVTESQMYQAAASNYGNWNTTIAAANSQANAFLYDEWYYWGENPVASSETTTSPYYYSDEYDYYTSRQSGGWYSNTYYTYYRYTTRHRAQYTHSYSYDQYSVTVPMASTGDWVDWDADDKPNHSDRREYTIQYYNDRNLNSFIAKVMIEGSMYDIKENQHGNNYYNRYYSTDQGDSESLTNNHMYVIQISSTSAEYVLGRPYVNASTHQSQDNVVSPAFMIASQLGAVTPFISNQNGAANAATHCSRYMEVAEDGTRYTGWRLPTEAEIRVITGYQYGTIGGVVIPSQYQVIVPVLTGQWYHSLSGQEVEANSDAGQGSTTKSYLRCVRDLSAEEVERLNGFDKIVEQYQNK